MTEPTYTLTLTESERTLWAKALGGLVTKLINAPIFVEAASGGTQAARAVLSPPPSPAVTPQPAPIELRDRWARDRHGNEIPNPEGCETRDVYLSKTEQKTARNDKTKPFLKVTWQSRERGYVDANCFDQRLWPWLIGRAGQETRLYLVKKDKYINVVGVRA